MTQHYPEPWQLQAYADEPCVFTDVNDLALDADGFLEGGEGVVGYRFEPTFIRVDPKDGESYEVSERDGATLDHAGVWSRQCDTTVEDNAVVVTCFTTDMLPEEAGFDNLVEAHWRLSDIHIVA